MTRFLSMILNCLWTDCLYCEGNSESRLSFNFGLQLSTSEEELKNFGSKAFLSDWSHINYRSLNPIFFQKAEEAYWKRNFAASCKIRSPGKDQGETWAWAKKNLPCFVCFVTLRKRSGLIVTMSVGGGWVLQIDDSKALFKSHYNKVNCSATRGVT